MLRSHLIRIGLALAVTLLLTLNGLGFLEIPYLQQLEQIAYDTRVRFTMQRGIDQRIVIVDIDEKSLAEEGRWPWGRDRLALMLDRLFDDYGAAVAGFDVVFAERDESSGIKVLKELEKKELRQVPEYRAALARIAPQLDRDALFAKKLAGRPVILGFYFTANTDQSKIHTSGELPDPQFGDAAFKGLDVPFENYNGYGANLTELQLSAAGGGHFTPLLDIDGVVRRVPMLVRYDHGYYEPLALAVARAYLNVPRVRPVFPKETTDSDYRAIERLMLGQRAIPVDKNVAALVPYRGPAGSFRYVSAVDVLKNQLKVGELAGKIVLVGTTAPGLRDLRATPVGNEFPGVEIHANMIAGIIDQNIKERPAYVLAVELILLALTGLVLGMGLPFLSPIKASLLTLTVLTLSVGGNLAAWQHANLVLPLVSSMLLILLIFGINMSYGFFVESRAKQRIAGLFGQYIPPELVEELNRHPELCSMEGESRELTVLFSDIRNFTSIAESMPPQELSKLMNFYLTAMTEVIQQYRGTIDKYIGDATMAFWGAPLSDPEHAAHALEAALEMQTVLKNLGPLANSLGWPTLRMGIGLNTGAMVVGNMGSRFRRAYTVLGDAVNLASRVEGLTKEYGVEIIVGEAVHAALPHFAFRELDRVKVKGKDQPVSIYEPLGRTEQVDAAKQRDAALFSGVLTHYRAQRWNEAQHILDDLLREQPDSELYRLYLERIGYFSANPPPADWDGVFAFKTK